MPGKMKMTVGSIVKNKDKSKPDYLKLRTDNKDVLLKALANSTEKGLILNLETKASQIASLNDAVASGKLKEEWAVKNRERLEKIPDYVRFEVTLLVDKE